MSQFGVVLIIEKDSGPVSDKEKATKQQQLSDILFAKRYADFRRTGIYKTLHAWEEESLCSRLVEYKEEEYADEPKPPVLLPTILFFFYPTVYSGMNHAIRSLPWFYSFSSLIVCGCSPCIPPDSR